MKTRVLSLVLAVIMVVSMAAVFTFTASADEEAVGVTVTMGTVYATAGSTAMVDLYVSAESLPEAADHLRNWQFNFESTAPMSGDRECYVSAKDAYSFFNEGDQAVGNSADTGYDCGTAAQVTSRGGWKIGSVGFSVPDGATGEIEVAISEIKALSFEKKVGDEYVLYKVKTQNSQGQITGDFEATTVAGKIIIVGATDGVVASKVGAGEDYAIPSVADGTFYSKMTKSGKLTGEFGTVVVPASITSVAGAAINGATVDKFVLKNTNLDKATVGLFVEKANTAVYYTKRANGADTTKANIEDYIENDSENEPEVYNILDVYAEKIAATYKDEALTAFVVGIAANDLDYDSLTAVISGNGKTKEVELTGVYKTVRGVASTTEEGAAAQNVEQVDGFAYIAGIAIRGIPAGEYSVTLYGVTADYNGNPIVVCSDTVSVTV